MKMSDVFCLPVNGACVHVNFHKLQDRYNDGVTPFDAIDTSINNHDRMVEEIAELKGDSLELIKAIKFLYKNTRHISELQSKNIESMIEYHEAKLNQEGEE